MDPSNVLGHCHNNGWLSLPCEGPFPDICQQLSRKEKRGQVAWVWAWCVAIGRCNCLSAVSLVCSMDPSNVLGHCHNNGWLSLPCECPFPDICQQLSRKEKRGQVAWVWPWCVVSGGCNCLLLCCWCVP